MQLHQPSVRAGYLVGRKSILAEVAALRDEMDQRAATLRADAAAIFRQLQDAKDQLRATELAFLDYKAGVVHDKQQLVEIERQRAEVKFACLQREPDTLLH